MSDGGTITTENQRRIARDSEGRIYEERWFLVPKNGKIKSGMTTIQISNPHAHTLYNCFMLEPVHQCILSAFSPSTDAVYNFQGGKTGPLPDDVGSVVHEDLGKQLVSGLERNLQSRCFRKQPQGDDRAGVLVFAATGIQSDFQTIRSADRDADLHRDKSDSFRARSEIV
jgi:hypothetical protein